VICLGVAQTDARARAFVRLARQNEAGDRIRWLGHRDDIGELMAASDLLVHPARLDITGTVILEAIANGLPVITTSVCGYAPHVAAAQAGIVLDEPFRRDQLVAAIGKSAQSGTAALWSANARRYGETTDLYSGLDRAADLIIADE
jgi:UDP-glucose:(heptosyl)LPS alpha-1,3-glucosyltransferase